MARVAQRCSLIAFMVLAMSLAPSSAAAEVPELFTKFPPSELPGSSSGRFSLPSGVGANPVNGHVYVADSANSRVSEFTAWGEFVKSWGWGVASGAEEAQTCTAICLSGREGTGPGQFSGPQAVSVSPAGEIYVWERRIPGEDGVGAEINLRVQKFDANGNFLLMFGAGVNKGPVHPGDLCTAQHIVEGDVCGAGASATGPGQFSNRAIGPYLAATAEGIYVGDKDRIQKFSAAGAYESQFPLPISGRTKALTSAPGSALYLALDQDFTNESPENPTVYKLSSSGAVTKELNVGFTRGLATDPAGNLYVAVLERQPTREEVIEFDATGKLLIPPGEGLGLADAAITGLVTNSACGATDLYLSYFRFLQRSYVAGFGESPDPSICPPPTVPPTVESQYAVSVGRDEAVVRAGINPHFWADTTFYVEYGKAPCASGGCGDRVLFPGASLGGKAVSTTVRTFGVGLADLEPGTTYHYRFVSASSGGGPVRGQGGEVGLDGADGTFTTFPAEDAMNSACPNGDYRIGLGAKLPDCRAYEMVSPVDKGNGNIVAMESGAGNYPALLDRASSDGQGLTYSAYRSFGNAESAPYSTQYLARRDPSGWSSTAISPPRNSGSFFQSNGLDNEFKAFSPDLCVGWLIRDVEPQLDAAAPAEFANVYRRDNCGPSGYVALNTSAPLSATTLSFRPELQGVSADGAHAVFRANDKLTSNASAKPGVYQVYEHVNDKLRLISVLPNGKPSEVDSSVGTASSLFLEGRTQSVDNAVSEDGSRIFWTAGGGEGQIYLRVEGEARSTQVSGLVSPANAFFWTASADGARAFFTIGDDLYEFHQEAVVKLAGDVAGMLGASDDGTRIYLVSEEPLASGAVAGEPNLFLREEGVGFTFMAALSGDDADNTGTARSPVSKRPALRVARVAPDGRNVAFMSTRSLTGFDNLDAESERPDAEVYLYRAEDDRLLCVSCNPTGVRPTGRNIEGATHQFWAAAQIPPWESQLYAQRVLADDGSRLFFESFEALVARDVNGKQDVYQWELPGTGDCTESSPAFHAENGGCVGLISSGEDTSDSRFVDATPGGGDVFFATASSLVSQDPDLIDVYDARVDGGFPSPPPRSEPCEGEACQSPAAPPPEDPAPASSVFAGPGSKAKKPVRCRKGKVRRKGRCVASKKHSSSRKRADRGRRDGGGR